MAKRASINIVIDEEGNLIAEPSGTEGPECLDLLAFLDSIPGLTVKETVKTEDFKKKKTQTKPKQNVSG
jgi:hypothetical protein